MAKKPLNVGMVGYGFMGRTHSNAFSQVGHFFKVDHQPVLKAVCGRDAGKAASHAEAWGYESVETDWRRLVERKDIDLIDIASPNDTHLEIALAAAAAGKMVMCEKPLGRSAAESRQMVEAVEAAKPIVLKKAWGEATDEELATYQFLDDVARNHIGSETNAGLQKLPGQRRSCLEF